MTDNTDGEESLDHTDGDPKALAAVSTDYKILGKKSAPNGTGVLGHNTATSGTSYGVEGAVDNDGGYGLYTADDAKVEGRLATSTMSLPPHDTIGDEPQRVRDAMTALFDEPAWAGPRYLSSVSVRKSTPAFEGAALAPTGEVIFAPRDSDNVGVYDPETDTYTSGPSHRQGDEAFAGTTLLPSGEVIFAPAYSDDVGVIDTNAQTHKSRVTALHPLVNNF